MHTYHSSLPHPFWKTNLVSFFYLTCEPLSCFSSDCTSYNSYSCLHKFSIALFLLGHLCIFIISFVFYSPSLECQSLFCCEHIHSISFGSFLIFSVTFLLMSQAEWVYIFSPQIGKHIEMSYAKIAAI